MAQISPARPAHRGGDHESRHLAWWWW